MESKIQQVKNLMNDALFKGIAAAILLILLLFVLYPIIKLIWASVYSGEEFTLNWYSKLFEVNNLKIIWNTVFVSCLSTFFATILGLVLALNVVRSPWPGKRVINFAAILHIISPPFVAAIVFILLLGRRGFITNTILGLDVNLIGWQAIVFLQTLGNASIAYLVIGSVLKRLDRNLEKSALDLGATKSRVFFTITLPLLMPGITAAGLLVFTSVLADFGTPILVGGGFRVLASEAYLQVLSQYNMGFAAALSMLLLIPCLSIIVLEKYILGNRGFISSVLSEKQDGEDIKGLEPNLGVSGFIYIICLTFCAITFTKFIVLALGAFTNIWGYDYSFSLRHWDAVWRQGFLSIKNSLFFAFQIAILGPLLGISTAYIVHKSKGIAKGSFTFLATLPYAIPGPVMGISFVMAFHHPPVALTGTALIIVMVCIIRELPISFNSGKAVLCQISDNIEQASLDLGAGRLRTFIKVIMPLMTPVYKIGMIHAFIQGMTTIGAIIFLIVPKYKVTTFEIFRATNGGDLGQGATFALILILLTLAGLAILMAPWQVSGFRKKIKERYFHSEVKSEQYFKEL